MADDTLDLQVNVAGEGAERTIGELRREYSELLKTVDQTVAGTKAYNDALLRLGSVKGELKDLKERIRDLDPEKKAAAFQSFAGKLAGGFQAAQAAAALFGQESENVQKALLKVQAATALAQGIQSVSELGKAFQQVGLIIKAAFASNPFGLILTAITAIVAAVGTWLVSTKDQQKSQDLLNTSMDGTIHASKELKDAYDDHQIKMRELNNERRVLLGLMSKEVSALDNLRFKHQKNLNDIAQETKSKLAETEGFWHSLGNKMLETLGIETDAQQIRKEGLKKFKEAQEQAALEEKLLKEQQANEKLKEENEKKEKDAEAWKKLQQEKEEREREESKKRIEAIEKEAEEDQEWIDEQKKKLEGEVHAIKTISAVTTETIQSGVRETRFSLLKMMLQDTEVRKKLAGDTLSAISSLGQIFINNSKKLQKFQKGIAVGTIAIESAEAVAKAVKSAAGLPFPSNLPAIFTAIATVLANIAKAKQLLSQAKEAPDVNLDIPGGGGGVSSVAPINTPENTSTGIQTTEQGNFAGFTGQQTPVVKAYVVESEMTQTQQRVRQMEQRATFE